MCHGDNDNVLRTFHAENKKCSDFHQSRGASVMIGEVMFSSYSSGEDHVHVQDTTAVRREPFSRGYHVRDQILAERTTVGRGAHISRDVPAFLRFGCRRARNLPAVRCRADRKELVVRRYDLGRRQKVRSFVVFSKREIGVRLSVRVREITVRRRPRRTVFCCPHLLQTVWRKAPD